MSRIININVVVILMVWLILLRVLIIMILNRFKLIYWKNR